MNWIYTPQSAVVAAKREIMFNLPTQHKMGILFLRLPDHLIPHLHHSNVGTVFFAVGFSVMMVLDVALG